MSMVCKYGAWERPEMPKLTDAEVKEIQSKLEEKKAHDLIIDGLVEDRLKLSPPRKEVRVQITSLMLETVYVWDEFKKLIESEVPKDISWLKLEVEPHYDWDYSELFLYGVRLENDEELKRRIRREIKEESKKAKAKAFKIVKLEAELKKLKESEDEESK